MAAKLAEGVEAAALDFAVAARASGRDLRDVVFDTRVHAAFVHIGALRAGASKHPAVTSDVPNAANADQRLEVQIIAAGAGRFTPASASPPETTGSSVDRSATADGAIDRIIDTTGHRRRRGLPTSESENDDEG